MNNAAIYTVLPQARHHAPISQSTREKSWDGRQNGLTSNISQTMDSSLSAKEHNQVVYFVLHTGPRWSFREKKRNYRFAVSNRVSGRIGTTTTAGNTEEEAL